MTAVRLRALCGFILLIATGAVAELKPGDVLGPDNWQEAKGLLPDEFLDLSTLCGDPGQVQERLAAFKDVGVSYLNIAPVGEDPLAIIEQVKAWAE